MSSTLLISRRQLFAATAGVYASGLAFAAPATLPLAISLQDELALALKKAQPLVVMVSLDGCPFCKIARENYLGPLHEQQGLPVIQVDMRSTRIVKNFNGVSLSHDDMRRAWGVKVAPTVLFFGQGGQEIAARMVGGYIPDFYGAYLDERLLQARAAIKKLSS